MPRCRHFVAIAAAAAFVLTGTAHASLVGVEFITNGGFEMGNDPGSFSRVEIGETDITGWSVTSGNIDYIGTIWQASAGSRSVDLNGNQAGTFGQSFTTEVGKHYEVTFDMAGNPTMGETMELRAMAAAMSMDFSFDTSGFSLSNMGWQTMTWSFVATSTTTTLEFMSLTTGTPRGAALDNVSVVQMIPTPATAFALLLGGIVMGGRSRRRRG